MPKAGSLLTFSTHTESAKESKGSLGQAEGAHWKVEGRLRVLRKQVKDQYGLVFDSNHVLMPWAVRAIGWSLTRFQTLANGHTAYRNQTGKGYSLLEKASKQV